MAIFSQEIKNYAVYQYLIKGDRLASVNLITETYSFYVNFYKDGTTLPVPSSPINGGRQQIYLHVYFNQFQAMIDLLRNEKPVYAFYRDDVKMGYVSTSTEPVGESE